ncbi:MAG: efflux RND transporter periplasmic adaptor subunit [Acidobacteriaceae bacterium]|nr:efflux RND transporter periplasmic adaptor subunit [Acidobacteriaceae bacterium]
MKFQTSVFALALGGVLASTACQKATTAPAQLPAVRIVRVSAATTDTSSDALRFSGVLEPYRRVDLAFRVGGYVGSIRQERGSDGRMRALEPGDTVRRGELLATIRPTDYRAHVEQSSGMLAEAHAGEEQARAQLAQVSAQEEQAQRDWERAQILFKAEALTKPDFDATKAKEEASVAQVNAAKAAIATQGARQLQANADLSAARVSLGDTELRSPLDGTVLSRSVEVGTLAATGGSGFSLADIRLIKAVFGVPDVDLRQLQAGKRLPVTIEALGGASFIGVVTSVAPIADERTRTYNVQLTLENPKLQLKPGMISSITLVGPQHEAASTLTVPLTALARVGTNDSAFGVYKALRSGNGHVIRLQPVELGAIRGNQVVITKGLTTGDEIVQSGGSQLSDGQAVTVAE